MTKDNRARAAFGAISASLAEVSGRIMDIQLRKSKRGAVIVVGGILGIGEFSESEICLLSHSGRLTVRGEGLLLSSLENRTVEIYGKINGLELGYGKN